MIYERYVWYLISVIALNNYFLVIPVVVLATMVSLSWETRVVFGWARYIEGWLFPYRRKIFMTAASFVVSVKCALFVIFWTGRGYQLTADTIYSVSFGRIDLYPLKFSWIRNVLRNNFPKRSESYNTYKRWQMCQYHMAII